MEQTKNILLSISILVSNRIKTIKKCMESLSPLLEQLPSELIVVDTVGEEKSDGSLAIAKEYATKVVHFDWCNDFAAARNAGLTLARGKWFMFIDDDEWFEDVSEIISFFKSGEYEKYNSASLLIKDYRNHDGSDFFMGYAVRIARMEKETKFVGTVHEHLNTLKTPTKDLATHFCHCGYVFDTEEEHRQHSQRNLTILRPEFEKNPWDLKIRTQMVQECLYLPELREEARAVCEGTLQMDKSVYVQPTFQWIITSYVRLAEQEKNWESLIERANMIRKKFPINSFTNAAISVMQIMAYEKKDAYEEILCIYPELKKAYEFLSKNPKIRREQGILNFETFLEPSLLRGILEKVILSAHVLGRTELATDATTFRQCIFGKPMLSISLLVSNRIDTIRNCMESLKPLLNAVPSELIIVDTVGEEQSDGSHAIAKEYATEVVRFEWCKDFAAARNAGLTKTQGEWFLFLDDDEWFEDTTEIIRFFMTGEYLNYASGTYRQRNYTNAEGTIFNDVPCLRMIKKTENTEFVGTIHETFSEVFRPCKDFSAYVHHYGYVYADETEKEKHRKRNLPLLEAELAKNPKNMRYRAQMALELASFDNERALAFCEETFALCADAAKENGFQWQLSLVFRLYEALGASTEQARATYEELKEKFGYSETAESGICFQMTRIHILCGEYVNAYTYAAKYFQLLDWLQQHPEEQQQQMTADFYRYQSREGYLEMLHFGAYCAWQAKAYADAWNWYAVMPWEEESYVNEESFGFMIALAYEYTEVKTLVSILKRIMQNGAMMTKTNVRNQIGEVLRQLKG